MIECVYVDHESETNHEALAHESERLRAEGVQDLLVTCHRVEKYGESLEDLPLENTTFRPEHIKSTAEVFERLSNIAAGTKSQIVGEWAIFDQVQGYVNHGAQVGKVRDLGEQALELASTLRKDEMFYSPDHATIALREVTKETNAKLLLVFGAGMIGMNLAKTYKDLGFENIILVTRNRKKARKGLRHDANCKVATLEDMVANPPREKCNVVIASTNMSGHRVETIVDFVRSLECPRVVDVCGESLFSESEGHIALEGRAMQDLINEHNKRMEDKRRSIQDKIKELTPDISKKLESKWTY